MAAPPRQGDPAPLVIPSLFGVTEAALERNPPGFPKISWDGSSGGIDGDRATCGVSPQLPKLGWDRAL